MPRSLVTFVLACCAVSGLPALDWGAPTPVAVWSLTGPTAPVSPGQSFTVTAEVTLPPGYYQDTDSTFLKFEPQGAIQVLDRRSSEPSHRGGKSSFTGTFTLTRTVILGPTTPPGPYLMNWKIGWQICQTDGVCLLPAEKTISISIPVGSAPAPGLPLPGISFWGALVAAFFGGILLNFMPCVFPVLALKGLALASSSRLSLPERRREALLFASGGLGVLLGIGVITAFVLSAGQRLDWGFSFQQPIFVWVLILAFWLFTLQLWGVWSWPSSPFSLSQSFRPGRVKSVIGGAFFVLAAVPCTAPLLGAALGFAFSQPPVLVPLFFGLVGLGLVTPLVILQWVPALTKLLPKPGRWMVTLERIFGFVLSATVLYLLWIFTKQTSSDRIWPSLGLLVAMAAALAWTGRSTQLRWRKIFSGGLLALLIALSILLAATPTTVFAKSQAVSPEKLASGWAPFSEEALQKAIAAGHPVLVDATAAWCATCQLNELAVLDRRDVTRSMDTLGLVRLRADYTVPDPAIETWLASVNRAGLPVDALYRPGHPVYIFPELLTDANFTQTLPQLLSQ